MSLAHLPLIAPRHSLTIAITLLMLAVLPMPYGYYLFMRLMLTIIFGWIAKRAKRDNDTPNFWLMLMLAVLFNPLFAITLPRELWIPIDLALAFILWRTQHRYGHVSRA